MIIGEVNKLKVKRVADISYILEDGDEEIFLHKKETLKDHNEGDMINVFIYLDSKRRICASEQTPLITASKPTFLKVVGYKEGTGYFLYDGMPKDLLLAEDDCEFGPTEKPEVGDYLFCYLKVTSGTFRARLVPKAMYPEYFKPVGTLDLKEFYPCYVTSRNSSGITCHTFDGFEIFVSRGCDRDIHRIGELLTVEIIKKTDDTHYHGSLLKNKVVQMDEDSKKIYKYLRENKQNPITEELSPIEIYNLFQMSKSAFKRAIGHLYKERLIELAGPYIKLKVE